MASAEKFADSTHANRPYLGHFLISNLIVMPTLCCGYNLDFPSILMDANSSSYKQKKSFPLCLFVRLFRHTVCSVVVYLLVRLFLCLSGCYTWPSCTYNMHSAWSLIHSPPVQGISALEVHIFFKLNILCSFCFSSFSLFL